MCGNRNAPQQCSAANTPAKPYDLVMLKSCGFFIAQKSRNVCGLCLINPFIIRIAIVLVEIEFKVGGHRSPSPSSPNAQSAFFECNLFASFSGKNGISGCTKQLCTKSFSHFFIIHPAPLRLPSVLASSQLSRQLFREHSPQIHILHTSLRARIHHRYLRLLVMCWAGSNRP